MNTILLEKYEKPKKNSTQILFMLIHKQRQKYDHNQIHKPPEPLLIYVLLQDLSLSWLLHTVHDGISQNLFSRKTISRDSLLIKIPLSPQLAELWTSLPPDLAFPPRYTHPGSSQTGQSPAGTWIQRKMKMSLNVVVAGRIFVCEFTYCGPCE